MKNVFWFHQRTPVGSDPRYQILSHVFARDTNVIPRATAYTPGGIEALLMISWMDAMARGKYAGSLVLLMVSSRNQGAVQPLDDDEDKYLVV